MYTAVGGRTEQRSFHKTGTMGTLASQAELGVWVQALRALTGFGLHHRRKISRCVCKILQYLVHFWRSETLRQWNAVSIRSDSFFNNGIGIITCFPSKWPRSSFVVWYIDIGHGNPVLFVNDLCNVRIYLRVCVCVRACRLQAVF